VFSAVAALFAAAFDDFETPPLKNDIKVAGFESFDANEWKIHRSSAIAMSLFKKEGSNLCRHELIKDKCFVALT
jgi:hypothetical protein